jgi:hypothetical protein
MERKTFDIPIKKSQDSRSLKSNDSRSAHSNEKKSIYYDIPDVRNIKNEFIEKQKKFIAQLEIDNKTKMEINRLIETAFENPTINKPILIKCFTINDKNEVFNISDKDIIYKNNLYGSHDIRYKSLNIDEFIIEIMNKVIPLFFTEIMGIIRYIIHDRKLHIIILKEAIKCLPKKENSTFLMLLNKGTKGILYSIYIEWFQSRIQ